MPYKTKLNLIQKGDKEELMDEYNAFKAKFSAMTEPDIEDFSDYVHVSMTSLQDSMQDELTSLMRSLKIIADDATKYLKFALGSDNCKTFFCHPIEPFDLIATISSFKTVKYETEEEANSAGFSLYWPGGGTVTAEYRTNNNENVLHMASSDSYISEAWIELSDQLRQHMSKWHNDVSEENHQSEKDTSHYYRWTIAIEKKNTEFMNKLTYIKALLPEIVISMKAWSSWMAENIIEEENHIYSLSNGDEGIDMTVFE
nr:hypothetical protein [uncultured Janthinobacterium sp.]